MAGLRVSDSDLARWPDAARAKVQAAMAAMAAGDGGGEGPPTPQVDLAVRPTRPTITISAQRARNIARGAALDAWRRMRLLPVPAWRVVCREVSPAPLGRLATGGAVTYRCRGWLTVGTGRHVPWEAVVDGATGAVLGVGISSD